MSGVVPETVCLFVCQEPVAVVGKLPTHGVLAARRGLSGVVAHVIVERVAAT